LLIVRRCERRYLSIDKLSVNDYLSIDKQNVMAGSSIG